MSNQLAISARPRTLDALVGQHKLVDRVRGHTASGRITKSWLLCGPTGCGKTTTAIILGTSLQCEHQAKFGSPCKECQLLKYDIYEINCARITGIRELESELEGSIYAPRFGKYRVYILDEVHRSSSAAQDLMLKYLEEGYTPETTIFILCSTAPQKLSETLQGRCTVYRLRPLELGDVTILVARLLKRVKSVLPADRLVDALVERGITYPRLIANAVEKYIAGGSPEEASDVEGSTEVDTKALCRAVVKGDWQGVTKYMSQAQTSDVRAIRLGCIAYLRTILWTSPEIEERTGAVAKAVSILCELHSAEDMVMSAGLTSALYSVTAIFAKYKH